MPARVRTLKLTEAEFQRQVIELAKALGWKVAHFRPGMTRAGRWGTQVQADGAGWPDLFLCRPRDGKILALELKVPPNKTTPAQREWIEALRRCGIEAAVVTPEEWQHIERMLS